MARERETFFGYYRQFYSVIIVSHTRKFNAMQAQQKLLRMLANILTANKCMMVRLFEKGASSWQTEV
jgi:hypothetical protein